MFLVCDGVNAVLLLVGCGSSGVLGLVLLLLDVVFCHGWSSWCGCLLFFMMNALGTL